MSIYFYSINHINIYNIYLNIITTIEKISNDENGYYPITIIKKYSNLQLSLPSSSIKLAIKEDKRLEYLNISKGFNYYQSNNSFPIENILEYWSSKIGEDSGLDGLRCTNNI